MNKMTDTSRWKRFEKGKANRKNWDAMWDEVAMYVMPHKADFIADRPKGDRTRQLEIFDPTAAVSNHTLASHMHSSMTSPASQWFELRLRQNVMSNTAKKWIEECTSAMYKAIHDSNFVAAINELYQALIAFGTACLEVSFIKTEADGFRLVFREISMGSLVVFENVHGQVDTVYHEMKLTVRQIEQLLEDDTPEHIKKKIEKDPDQEDVVVRVVEPNPDWDEQLETPNSMKRRYIMRYMIKGITYKKTGLYGLSFLVPRWSKVSKEPFGFGPALLALPDVKSINEAKRLELRGWEKSIDPPLWGMAGSIVGSLHLEASGLTKVRDRNAIGRIGDGTDWNATQIKAQEIRQNIQAVFLIDQLILPERPNATATEVQIRYEMMQKVLGPTMGRLESELLNPLVQRVFDIMYREGQLPKIPKELEGMQYEVRYTGPLARAQTSDDAIAVERLMSFVLGTGQIDPTVVDVIDMKKALRIVAEQWGVPIDVLRSEDDVEEIEKARAEAQKAQAEKQDAIENAQVVEANASAEASMANVEALRTVGGA